ncbi:MAG: hypothetical protein ABSC56_00455 [Solirubrobacteraceae bacterium]
MKRWGSYARGGLSLAGATLALSAAPALADVPISVSSYPTPTSAADPQGMVLGPDGALWFTEEAANQIGRITQSGSFTEYPITATPGSKPIAIVDGSGGVLWFTQNGTGEIAQITTGGVISDETSVAAGTEDLAYIPSGDLWVTAGRDIDEVSAAAPSAVVNSCTAQSADPQDIVDGSNGELWFTEPGNKYVGEFPPNCSAITTYPLPSASTSFSGIVSGPDGNLWVGQTTPSAIVNRLTTGGAFSSFGLPSGSEANPAVIGDGPDGQLWMAGGGDLTSVTTTGAFNTFGGLLPGADDFASIVAGPSGSDQLWLTDATSSTIYRVTLGTPTIGASLLPAASVGLDSAAVSGTLSVPSGDLSQGVTYQFDYGTTTAYGSSTSASSTTASAAGTQVSATLSGLLPFTTYHYKLVASGCSPSTCSASTGDQSFTTGVTLTPVFDQSVVIAGISGKILVKLKGTHKFVRVSSPELIPLGAEINARHGTVLIDSATQAGTQAVASGQFAGGLFYVQQPPGAPTTVIDLASSFAACRAKAHHTRHASMARARKKSVSHKVVNQVFGNAHGQYTTQGHYAAAADEGTSWQVADRCDGTYVAVSVGQVNVTNLVTQATFALSAGQHYLAAAR